MMKRIAILLWLAVAAAADPPDGMHLSVPKARRTLAAHVKEILAQTPDAGDKTRGLELDELVCAEREVEWGAEGAYWDVVMSLANASNLAIEDTWTQHVKLTPWPGKLRGVRIEGDVLTGWHRTEEDGEVAFDPVVVIPFWYEMGGWQTPEVTAEHDPSATAPHEEPQTAIGMYGRGWKVPATATKVSVSWGIERYVRSTTESVEFKTGARFELPAGAGKVEIGAIGTKRGRLGDGKEGDLATVEWTSENVSTASEELVLEDGTVAGYGGSEGSGFTKDGRTSWSHRSTYDLKGQAAKSFRFKVVHEAAWLRPVRTFDRKELDAAPPKDLLSGPIFWTRAPAEGVDVLVGAVRADGWGCRTGRISLQPEGESGALEGTQDNTGWDRPILLAKEKGGDLRYRVFGLDAGEWFVWTKAGNWIDVRRIPVPGGASDGDVVIALNHAARITVRARSGESAMLRPIDDKTRPIGTPDELSVTLERGEDGAWTADGIRPGDYLLRCGIDERGVKLREGDNEFDLRK